MSGPPRAQLPAVAVLGDATAERVLDVVRDLGIVPGEAADAAIIVLCGAQASRSLLADAAVQREAHTAPIVAVVGAVPTAHLARTLLRRFEGVVTLDTAPTALGPALAAVAVGQTCHPVALREALDRPLLSPREKQVLAMVVLGLPNVEIAGRLFVTEASVKAHLTSAFAKLGVRSRAAATELILDPDAGYGPGILRITPESEDPSTA